MTKKDKRKKGKGKRKAERFEIEEVSLVSVPSSVDAEIEQPGLRESLVQHAIELGRLRAKDEELLTLLRAERARITAIEKHNLKAAKDANLDRARIEEVEEFVGQLHNRLHDLEPKDVDPRQCPEPENMADPRQAPPEVMEHMGRVALEKRAIVAEQARNKALEWQARTNAAKRQLQLELDGAMAELREVRGQLDDARQYIEQKERESVRDRGHDGMPTPKQLGEILNTLRFMCYDASEAENGGWDEPTEVVVEVAQELLDEFSQFLPDQGCGGDTVQEAFDEALRENSIEPANFVSTERKIDYDAIEGRQMVDMIEHHGLKRKVEDLEAQIERLKADIASRDCQISELHLRVQQYLSDETLRPKWLYNELDTMRARLREAEDRQMMQLEQLNQTIQLQARMLGAAANAMGVTTVGLSRPAEAYVPTEAELAKQDLDKWPAEEKAEKAPEEDLDL